MCSGPGRRDQRYHGLRADLLNVLCRLGHTNPTNISISHLQRNHFRQDSEEALRETIDMMIADGDPISYLSDRHQAQVHVTDTEEAQQIVNEIWSEHYDL